MSKWQLHLLGTIRLEREGRPVQPDTHKALALLAYLVLNDGTCTRADCEAFLWPELPAANAQNALRRTLSALRKVMGSEPLHATRQTISIFPLPSDVTPVPPLTPETGIWVDVCQFRHLLAQKRPQALAQALALYRGEFMNGFSLRDSPPFDEWQAHHGRLLHQEAVHACEALVQHYADHQQWETAVEYGQQWLALDPLHEPAHRLLMQFYSHMGARADALRQYRACTRLLQAELHIEPESATTRLYLQIRDGRFPPANPPPPNQSALTPHHNLPVPATPFIGRERELKQIQELLAHPNCRLLTLIGLGGMGKTRLALETASRHLSHFQDGVFFVNLASLPDDCFLAPAIADALNFQLNGARSVEEQINRYLRPRQMLLVLDNFEPVLNRAAWLSDLLENAPGLKLLVTSRERLHLQEEWVIAITGLDIPKAAFASGSGMDNSQASALQLFLRAARRHHPDSDRFSPARPSPDLTAVTRICQLLEGMPLGIEMAATWVHTLPAAELAAAIEQNYRFLATPVRNVPSRHRSLEAVFASSWSLLTPSEQQALGRLTVFQRGFTSEAAQQVTGVNPPLLRTLTDKSLLYRDDDGRLTLHEAFRLFVVDKIDELAVNLPDLQDRHSAYYLQWLDQAAARLDGAQPARALETAKAEAGNIFTAWQWAVQHRQIARIGRAAAALAQLYDWLGWDERGINAFDTAVAMTRQHTRTADDFTVLGRLLAYLAAFKIVQRQFEPVPPLLQESQIIATEYEDPVGMVLAWKQLVHYRASIGELAAAEEAAQEYLAYCRQYEVDAFLGDALKKLGVLKQQRQAYRQAETIYLEALTLARRRQDHRTEAQIACNLGSLYQNLGGDPQRALAFLWQSLELLQHLGDGRTQATVLVNLGQTLLHAGDLEEATQTLADSLTISRRYEDVDLIISALYLTGRVACEGGEHEQAMTCFEEALVLTENDPLHAVLPLLCRAAADCLGHHAHPAAARYRLERLLQVCAEAAPPPSETNGPWQILFMREGRNRYRLPPGSGSSQG